jgi:O-antigen/teichoic acid export membrane protein
MSKEYTRLYVQVFIAIINVSCALYFIPRYWINWAAYALIIAECSIMIWYRLFTKYHIKWLRKLEKSENK